MKTEKESSDNDIIASTEKKLRNVRTCLYILILAAIAKFAMTDFYESSFRTWLNVAILFLIVFRVLAVEKGLRKKLRAEKKKAENSAYEHSSL